MVISTAATEGRGFHSLLGETGSKLYNNMKDLWEMTIKNVLGKIKFALYSPNVSAGDVFHFYPKSTIFHNNFKKLLSELETYYGDAPKVGIFPSSTQMPMK